MNPLDQNKKSFILDFLVEEDKKFKAFVDALVPGDATNYEINMERVELLTQVLCNFCANAIGSFSNQLMKESYPINTLFFMAEFIKVTSGHHDQREEIKSGNLQ